MADIPEVLPDFLGKFPVKIHTDKISSSPAKLLNFKCYEYSGVELFKKIHTSPEDREVIGKKLDVGNMVFVPGLFDDWHEMTVESVDGKLWLGNENWVGTLELDKDDRHCWVCSGMINKKCFDMIEAQITVEEKK